MGSSSNAVRPEEVMESLKNDGTIDALRMKIIAQLKANEDMKKNTLMMVEQSKVLNTPGAEKKTKRELFDALRQELEERLRTKRPKVVGPFPGPCASGSYMHRAALLPACVNRITPVLEKASKAVWELIIDNGGLGKEITDTVEKVFCRLGGIDMMPAPPAAGPHQVKDEMDVDDGEKSIATDQSLSRKRPFSDMSRKGAGAATNGSGTDQHELSEDGN